MTWCTNIREFVIDISTHTLTWSVTVDWQSFICTKSISTHTLTWSVTKSNGSVSVSLKISTHTLTWSVTNLA